jgi:hypothetical protein
MDCTTRYSIDAPCLRMSDGRAVTLPPPRDTEGLYGMRLVGILGGDVYRTRPSSGCVPSDGDPQCTLVWVERVRRCANVPCRRAVSAPSRASLKLNGGSSGGRKQLIEVWRIYDKAVAVENVSVDHRCSWGRLGASPLQWNEENGGREKQTRNFRGDG